MLLPVVTVRLPPTRPFTNRAVEKIQSLNPDLRLEVDAQGNLIVMPPAGDESSALNSELTIQLGVWARRDGSGITFDSSGGFRLPNGALRAADAAWVTRARWAALPRAQRRTFSPLCPDFVAELRSPTDDLEALHAKMREYRDNGARLGWLLDPETRTVWVYRAGQDQPQELRDPETVAGDPLLPGFVLDVRAVWQAAEP